MAPKVHTAEQAAEIIGGNCKASWLREKARRREIPHTMIGGSYGWTGAHIDEIIAMFERRPEAPRPARAQARRREAPAEPPAVPVLRAKTPRRLQSVSAA